MLAEGSFGKMPEKAMESAKRIEDSAKLMAMSIEDYLNVSRIESGNMKYNLSDFNLRDMVDSICDDLRPEALKKSLILLFRSNLTSRGLVNADVGKTNQIIHNLINNSLKYTQKGSISVFVRDDVKKKRIYIDITDTGIGMSKETAGKLFHKFSRADNANSVNVSGTGLGLFVALKMAEAMGGTITVQSEGDGKGSTFTIELPLAM
jgi:signal transduction histidine kinase